ncbi:hypothetical protein [Streptomyces sp. NPDC055709]
MSTAALAPGSSHAVHQPEPLPSDHLTRAALTRLLAGPTESVKGDLLHTDLPVPDRRLSAVTVIDNGGILTIALSMDVTDLKKTAVGQVVCTAWSAEAVRRADLTDIPIVLTGDGHRTAPLRCADFRMADSPHGQ